MYQHLHQFHILPLVHGAAVLLGLLLGLAGGGEIERGLVVGVPVDQSEVSTGSRDPASANPSPPGVDLGPAVQQHLHGGEVAAAGRVVDLALPRLVGTVDEVVTVPSPWTFHPNI